MGHTPKSVGESNRGGDGKCQDGMGITQVEEEDGTSRCLPGQRSSIFFNFHDNVVSY